MKKKVKLRSQGKQLSLTDFSKSPKGVFKKRWFPSSTKSPNIVHKLTLEIISEWQWRRQRKVPWEEEPKETAVGPCIRFYSVIIKFVL